MCNGCGVDTETSREHLIHRRVGEAILGIRDHPDTEAMRRELLDGYIRFSGNAGDVSHTGVRLDGIVRNLLCRDCNSGWASDLEELAGANLFAFLHEGGHLDLQRFLRWFVFFQFKAHMYYERSEDLASGPLVGLFADLQAAGTTFSMRLFAARLEVSQPDAWQFMFHEALPNAEIALGFLLATHSVLWFMPYESIPPLPIAQVQDGALLTDLPLLPAHLLGGTLVPRRTIDVLGEHADGP